MTEKIILCYNNCDMKNLDDLLKGGYNVNVGNLLETLLTYQFSIQLTASQILREQLEVKELLLNNSIDEDSINQQLKERIDAIADRATAMKNEWIASQHMKGE